MVSEFETYRWARQWINTLAVSLSLLTSMTRRAFCVSPSQSKQPYPPAVVIGKLIFSLVGTTMLKPPFRTLLDWVFSRTYRLSPAVRGWDGLWTSGGSLGSIAPDMGFSPRFGVRFI